MRVVANSIRGKKVDEALVNLEFTAKRASDPLRTLIMSALANAKAMEIPTENLIVTKVAVNAGKILYRRLPAARGSAHKMRKRTCVVYVELGDAPVKAGKVKIAKEEVVEKKEKKVQSKKPAVKKEKTTKK